MSEFSQTLKTWRRLRRYSQLDLALEADVSGRHVSFLETGRAQPSRDMVIRLGEALQVPLAIRDQMLTQAGFAVRYGGRDWSDDDMAPIRDAVTRMLHTHLPYPGLALDRLWVIQQLNPTAKLMFGQFGLGVGDSLLDLMTSGALSDHVENWPEVAHQAAARLRIESMAQGGVRELDLAVAHLSREGGAHEPGAHPVVPTILRSGELRLSMFSTLAQFGTPEDIALDDLKIELYYPMDDVTASVFEAMAKQDPASRPH